MASTVGGVTFVSSGSGASSGFGIGGKGDSFIGYGQAASGYGAGGAGASVADVSTNYAGGAGAPGLLIVREW
jgi:hypothetical protein